MTYFFETYGCQMNTAESAALKLVLEEKNWNEASDNETADMIILNTCSVRATAEKRVMGRLAHYKALKKKRDFTVVLAGCMADRLGEKLKEKGADYVMGTNSRSLFPHILEALEQGKPFTETTEKPVFSFSETHHEKGQFRSFIPIMHGCNNYCSYCIVPYVRGAEISRNPADILKEIRLASENGVREITLLGQNVNSYLWQGEELKESKEVKETGENREKIDFPSLLKLIAFEVEKTPIRWVRFLSSHPKDLSREAITVMAEHEVFCRHLHLCVQHGSDKILSAMNRRYTRKEYLSLVDEIRKAMPNISLSTDILIGFPGETEEDFEETLDLMEEVRFLYSYMYHYNPREGTAAFNLPNRVEEEVKRKRLSRVIELQKRHTLQLLKGRIGFREKVLIEGISRKNADELICRTERDESAVAPGKPDMIGSFAELRFDSLKGNTFRAKELYLCPGD